MTVPTALASRDKIGVIVVDHGSRRAESNDLLLAVVALFRQHSGFAIVEPAHMELAEPSVAAAFDRCVEQGAELVVVHPYFLLPGRHSRQDIPAVAAAAAKNHPGVPFLVTAPLGVHPLMAELMAQRIEDCLSVDGRGLLQETVHDDLDDQGQQGPGAEIGAAASVGGIGRRDCRPGKAQDPQAQADGQGEESRADQRQGDGQQAVA